MTVPFHILTDSPQGLQSLHILAKCPSVDEWVQQLWYIYTMKYYLAIKKKKISPFATAWMDMENIMLSEISQSEKDKYLMMSLIHGI